MAHDVKPTQVIFQRQEQNYCFLHERDLLNMNVTKPQSNKQGLSSIVDIEHKEILHTSDK
jgi:hypothetical protein